MSKYSLYLNDILRAIELIKNSTKNKDIKEFKSDRDLIDSNAMRIQIIGESISKLSNKIKEKHKKIDWKKYLQTRNIISHAYFAVNPEILWSIIKKDLPILKSQIQKIKKEILAEEKNENKKNKKFFSIHFHGEK